MKICIVGPGNSPIPPVGWGACEILVWDYYQTLVRKGYDVEIVNLPNPNEIISKINSINPDIVHIQYDDWFFIAEHISYKTIITSHYAYLEQPNKHGGYSGIFNGFLRSRAKIYALSNGIKETYVSYGRSSESVDVLRNGVRFDLFRFSQTGSNKSIYLAKIDYRKRQYLFQGMNIDDLYFAGNLADNRFDSGSNKYLGEWSKPQVYENLTEYANLVLLSDGEAHPLVCLEAMCAGLGLVISEYATANLDLSLPFIDVISEDRIGDAEYVKRVIIENRRKSLLMRNQIREYARSFDWDIIIDEYIEKIKKLIE